MDSDTSARNLSHWGMRHYRQDSILSPAPCHQQTRDDDRAGEAAGRRSWQASNAQLQSGIAADSPAIGVGWAQMMGWFKARLRMWMEWHPPALSSRMAKAEEAHQTAAHRLEAQRRNNAIQTDVLAAQVAKLLQGRGEGG